MTSRIYRPEHKHPQPAQEDLNPDASKGLNWGLAGPHPDRLTTTKKSTERFETSKTMSSNGW
jgi:hypothetical protein